MNSFFLAVGNKFVASQERVTLNLIGGGNNARGFDYGLQLEGIGLRIRNEMPSRSVKCLRVRSCGSIRRLNVPCFSEAWS